MNAHITTPARMLAAGLVMACAAGTGNAAGIPPAHAAGLLVTTLVDETVANGLCSLREAVTNARNDAGTFADCTPGAGADTITFGVSGTIALTSPLTPGTGTTIDGAGQSVTLSGNGVTRVVEIISPSPVVELRNLTVTQGKAVGAGGGILSFGNLTIVNSTFTANTATAGGGAITSGGNLTVTGSTFSGNTAPASGGGAIWVLDSTALLANTTLSGNTALFGGGLHSSAAA